MATKKSSKSKNTKTIKRQAAAVDHNHIGKCFIVIGLILTALIFGFCYYMSEAKTEADKQKIQAFDGLVSNMLYEDNSIEGERGVVVGETGITDDGDLYVDFVKVKYENDVIVAKQPARIHFQCNQKTTEDYAPIGCAHAYWYGDWEEVAEE